MAWYRWQLIVTMVTAALCIPAAHSSTEGFPKCYIAKGASESAKFPEQSAHSQCRDHCAGEGTTRFGLGREGYDGAEVRCFCGDFNAFGHMEHTCDYRCDDNRTCGGDNGSPYDTFFQPFWMSIYSVCEPGSYGLPACDAPCPQHCDDGCHVSTGHCIYRCLTGRYGDTCEHLCPANCLTTCSAFGTCFSCVVGWHGDTCDSLCPFNCRDNCNKWTGLCSKGCNPGYYGSTCNMTCPRNCYDTCDITTGVCDSRCQQGYHGLLCDRQCPLNCHQDSCSFLDGTCLGECEPGYHGDYCHETCPTNCADLTCDFHTGHCSSGCERGYFGDTCNETCPAGCYDDVCDVIHGSCSAGCLDGLHGDWCQYNCSMTCANVTCWQADGACESGCQAGWTGARCRAACPRGCEGGMCERHTGVCSRRCEPEYHGPRCDQPCPTRCRNSTCDWVSGDCTQGCQTGWMGSKCRIFEVSSPMSLKWVLPVTAALFMAGAGCGILVSYCVCRRKTKVKLAKNNREKPTLPGPDMDPLCGEVSKTTNQAKYLVKDEIRMQFNREVYLDLNNGQADYL